MNKIKATNKRAESIVSGKLGDKVKIEVVVGYREFHITCQPPKGGDMVNINIAFANFGAAAHNKLAALTSKYALLAISNRLVAILEKTETIYEAAKQIAEMEVE
jgi:hypothetical protein